MPALDLLPVELRSGSVLASTSLLQVHWCSWPVRGARWRVAAVERLPRAMNEVWNLGPVGELIT